MDFSSSENAENNEEKGTENCQGVSETIDPDYVSVLPEKLPSKPCLSEQQQDAKDNAVQKIKNIIQKQFAMEMQLKEQEIETIDQRIRQTKATLDRLRACVLARYYGMSQGFQEDSLVRSSRGSWSKPRRSRRECASYNSSKTVLKSHITKQLNNTGSFLSFPGNSHSTSQETTTNNPTLGQKFSSLDDYKNSVGSAALSFGNTSHLKLTNGEVESASVVAKASVLPTSGSTSQSASEKKSNNIKGSISQEQSILPSDTSIGCSSETQCNAGGTQSSASETQSSASETHLSARGTQSSVSGAHSSARGIQSSASRSQLSIHGTQSSASGIQSSASKTHLSARGIQSSASGTHSSARGIQSSASGTTQLSISSNLKGTQVSGTKVAASQTTAYGSGSRFYVKKRVIIGNTSKYISPEKREENDKSTHKWMVYVRGPPEDPHIDAYIQKVWFFLHPSYRPNDIIEVSKPPFRLTRRGWGEFPIRVQLHFVGTRNKRVDIIHELKLDKTYTGLQTLGAETVVDLEIDRKTFEDLGIPVSSEISQDTNNTLKTATVDSINLDINSIRNPEIMRSKREHSFSSVSSETGQLSTSAVKRPRLDTPMSSFPSTPCGSRISSRCASPVLKNTSEIHDDVLENHLHSFAEKIPLISSKKNVVSHPFSARNVEEFCSWNVGKRRAAEWQRAAKIRAQLKKCVENSDMTTKGVMIWCRRFGYTPKENLVINEKVEYCKVCGKLTLQGTKENLDTGAGSCTREECSKVAQMEMSSLTPVDEILKEIEDKEKLLNEIPSQKDTEEELEIDVVSSFKTTKPCVSKANPPAAALSLPLTPQQQWVKDICNDIGISIRPITFQNVEVNAVESILLKLAMKFAENLLRKASSLSTKSESSLDASLIVPVHVCEAISTLSSCDFLGNSYFGHASEVQ